MDTPKFHPWSPVNATAQTLLDVKGTRSALPPIVLPERTATNVYLSVVSTGCTVHRSACPTSFLLLKIVRRSGPWVKCGRISKIKDLEINKF